MAGDKFINKVLGFKPTVYHMNEGHSSFLNLEINKKYDEKKKSII